MEYLEYIWKDSYRILLDFYGYLTGFLEYILRDPNRILQDFWSTCYWILIGSYRILRLLFTGYWWDLAGFLEYILQDPDRILHDPERIKHVKQCVYMYLSL